MAHRMNNELVAAVRARNASRVRLALQQGASPNTTLDWTSTEGITYKAGPVLSYAVAGQAEDVGSVTALLETPSVQQAIDVDSRGDVPVTPLLDATIRGYSSIVQLLLTHKADPDLASGEHTRPPLVEAALRGHLQCCRLLLHYGASPDATDCDGYHGIYCAASGGHEDVIRLIIDYGGDPQLKVQGWMTAAEHARDEGHHDLAAWLDTQTKLPVRVGQNLTQHS